MRLERADNSTDKGWFVGPWNSHLAVPIGFANAGIDEPHVHDTMFEVYLVARGTSVLRVGQQSVTLAAGDAIILEPGEAHTFLESSSDYLHFVVHAPQKGHELVSGDKALVAHECLGLPSAGGSG